jgi:hypothetical protein
MHALGVGERKRSLTFNGEPRRDRPADGEGGIHGGFNITHPLQRIRPIAPA